MACGNDGWLAGMAWDEGFWGVFGVNSGIPLLAALASPFAVRRGVVGAVLGGISGVPCVLRFACTCLLRGAKGRSPSRLRGAGRCQMSRADRFTIVAGLGLGAWLGGLGVCRLLR